MAISMAFEIVKLDVLRDARKLMLPKINTITIVIVATVYFEHEVFRV